MFQHSTGLSIGSLASLACTLEVYAPKPGNVHRGADFEDTSFLDFLTSAQAITDPINRLDSARVGEIILKCVQSTKRQTEQNTNLGLILLLVPLAKASLQSSASLESANVAKVLNELKQQDSSDVFEAIRSAKPGGLGDSREMDVQDSAPADLLDAMRHAADWDLIAKQYSNNFETVFDFCSPHLENCLSKKYSLMDSIIHLHLATMAKFPDSLIKRKCGEAIAEQSAARAAKVLESGVPGDANYLQQLGDLDFWLRSDHNRRNPGTTADMVGATIFAGLVNKIIQPPYI